MRWTIGDGRVYDAPVRSYSLAVLIAVLGAVAPQAVKPPFAPSRCQADPKWNDPAPPQHIFGNTWYVGTCGLSAILITSDKGHILIDGDTDKAPPLIEASIRKAGFRIKDVKLIVNSHAHNDHAGGIAKLQRDSGAVVIARGADVDALERGRGDRSDPQFLSITGFPRVARVRRIADGEVVTLGPLAVPAHAPPGHTPGSTSFTWDSCEGTRCLHLAYAGSVSAISDDVYRFTDEAQHPGVVAAFRQGIAAIAAMPCDILLTPHPEASSLWLRMGAGASQPLVNANACREFAAKAGEQLDARIAKERATAR